MRKYLQIGFMLLLAIALMAYPLVVAALPFTPFQVAGLTMGFLGFAFWYFDGRLSNVTNAVEEGLMDHL